MKFLDCTLRDGGYYNSWDFPHDVIDDYLYAMQSGGVDIVELGFRSQQNTSFKGACAYTTDDFLNSLTIPEDLMVGVMINASELVGEIPMEKTLQHLFPTTKNKSLVDVVRIACHVHEFNKVLPASLWLKQHGFKVGFNLMQVATCKESELEELAKEAAKYPLDVLYVADSMGSMSPDKVVQVIDCLCEYWKGDVGVHTHDNMGMALQNTLRALDEGATWVDSTVTGMGRGPGNARTEDLAIEIAQRRGNQFNLVPIMSLISRIFKPMQNEHGWGTNTYYYLAGMFGIHPTYIQEMLNDSRYSEEDILSVIEHLRVEGGGKFSFNTLDVARHFYQGKPNGHWQPSSMLDGRELLLLGTGPGVSEHSSALESYIRRCNPIVMALNTQSAIAADLIHVRVACHPVRLLADCEHHTKLPQPLITPASMLPADVISALKGKELLDFGLTVETDCFEFEETHCVLPSSLVIAYALAIATSGNSYRVLMAGFDGYSGEDPRNLEMNTLLNMYMKHESAVELLAITPTRYELQSKSIYGI